MASKVIEIREPKRLQASKQIRQELKLSGLGMARINQLIGRDFSKFPPQVNPKKTPPARPPIEVGDIVQSELVADWTYEVLAIKDDQLEVKRVGMPAAPVETRSSWSVVLVGKKKPVVNLHTFTLKPRQVEQLGAIALMFSSLGYDVQDGETCVPTPNWVVKKGFKKLGDLYYLACEWEIESQNPELQMDSDSFVEMLVDWGVLTEAEARHEVA